MFGHSSFDPQLVHWQFEVYRWLFENFGGLERFRKQTLVTPTPDFFPFRPTGEHEYVKGVFETVKDYMGMEDWMCRLLPLDEGENPLETLRKSSQFYGSWSSAPSTAGLFELDYQGARIYYSEATAAEPLQLVATLSHELSHYLIASTVTTPPGGWARLEPMTDLTSVFRGFGIFLANSAFTFQQWGGFTGSGWQSSTHGYLKESELAFALAIFCTLNEIRAKQVKKFLRPNPRSHFLRAMKEMKHFGAEIEAIKRTDPIPDRD